MANQMFIATPIIIGFAALLLKEAYNNGSLPTVIKGLTGVAGLWVMYFMFL